MTMNDCKIAGYVGTTPELRFLPTKNATPVVSLRVGQSYTYTDQNKQLQRKTNWFSVVAYGAVANVAKAFVKGDNVVLDGQLEQREWQGKDGSKRQAVEIIAHNIAKLERVAGVVVDGAPEEDDKSEAERSDGAVA
jgi:single-strand DNA-binding protein